MLTDSEVEDFLKRPFADVIDEVKRLRAENISLAASIDLLKRKISAQSLAPRLYASQLKEAKSFLRTVVQGYGLQLASFPPEILLTIFKFTQPLGPPHHHEPSIFRGPRNPWLDSLKTKKTLVLVCKAWSAPATELLYSDVVLRRMGQISALADTFRTGRSQSLANLVRAIRVDMCVVLTHCARAVREDFEYILSQCRMLLSFVYVPHPHPHFHFRPHDFACEALPTGPIAFNPTWIFDFHNGRAGSLLAQLLSSRLLTLRLDLTTYDDTFHTLVPLFHSAPCLTSLDLGDMSSQYNILPSDTSSPPDLLFPALKTLSIYCGSPPLVQYVATQWMMPQLASLTCCGTDHIPTSLLDAHGKRLTYFHVMCADALTFLDRELNTMFLPRLHQLCPRISHLVIPIYPEERTALNVHSPTLRYLDISGRPSVAAYRALALAPTASAPQLKKVRLVFDLYAFIPRHFHPAHMPGSDRVFEDVSSVPWMQESDDRAADILMCAAGGIVEDFPECRVRQHPWAVAIDLQIPPEGDSEDEADGEYQYESLPSSPEDSDASGNEAGSSDDGGEAREKLECAHGDDGEDSDLEREWFDVENATPSTTVPFVKDGLLDSSGRQYDRETILERFSQSQLGDFLLE